MIYLLHLTDDISVRCFFTRPVRALRKEMIALITYVCSHCPDGLMTVYTRRKHSA